MHACKANLPSDLWLFFKLKKNKNNKENHKCFCGYVLLLPARTTFSFSAETQLTVCAAAILRLNFLKQEKGKRVDTLQLLALMAVYCDLLSIQTTANYVLIWRKKEGKKEDFQSKKLPN